MLALPLDAVAVLKLSVPWLGAEDCVQVRVWDESVSLTVSRLLMEVADAFWATLRVVVPPVKVGVVLPAVSSLVIVPVAEDVPSVALLGLDRVAVNVSSVVSVVSPVIETVKVWVVTPAAKVRVPLVAV